LAHRPQQFRYIVRENYKLSIGLILKNLE
jgi:hypothetical protein